MRVPARAPRWVVPLVKTLLASVDIVLAISSFTMAFYLRHHDLILHQTPRGVLTWSREFSPYALLLPLVIPIRLLLLRYYDLYRIRGEFSFVEDMARVFRATAIGSLLIVAATFMYRGGVAYRAFSYSRAVFLFDFLLALASIGAVRMLLRGGPGFGAPSRRQSDSNLDRRSRSRSRTLHTGRCARARSWAIA